MKLQKKIKNNDLVIKTLASRLVQIGESDQASEYTKIRMIDTLRILSCLTELVDEAIQKQITDEDKVKLYFRIEEGVQHYLYNSLESYNHYSSQADQLSKNSVLLQAQTREITHQYLRAAELYEEASEMTGADTFKDKIIEMREKAHKPYVKPSNEETWARGKSIHELTTQFLKDIHDDPIMLIDPILVVQKIFDTYTT